MYLSSSSLEWVLFDVVGRGSFFTITWLILVSGALLLFNRMSSSNYAISCGKEIQPVLVVTKCSKYGEGILQLSDHEIPLAICLLKGISCVWTWCSTGLLLCNRMSSSNCAVSCGKKIAYLLVNYCRKKRLLYLLITGTSFVNPN